MFFSAVWLSTLAYAQTPANILVYHDFRPDYPYGEEVLTAIGSLWPSAYVEAYPANPPQHTQFNSALDRLGQGWDMVIVESWYFQANDLNWNGLKNYFHGGGRLYVSSWEWNEGTNGQKALGQAMGVSAMQTFGWAMPHYCWQPAHPFSSGITDWGWTNPGLGIACSKMYYVSATPVTGWSPSVVQSDGALCVAVDGRSVVSGYVIALSNQPVKLWENILQFMWTTPSALDRTSWAGVKAAF